MANQERPNLLFIMSDDHAAHAISAYGSVINETPHLDRIAADGEIDDQVEQLIERRIPAPDFVGAEFVIEAVLVGRIVCVPFLGVLGLEVDAIHVEPELVSLPLEGVLVESHIR